MFYWRRRRIVCIRERMTTDNSLSSFDFIDFARTIYADPDKPAIDEQEKYLLPALYGGDPGDGKGNKFQALVVLHNPLFTFTKGYGKCNAPLLRMRSKDIGRFSFSGGV
jgi:hypothetical protein